MYGLGAFPVSSTPPLKRFPEPVLTVLAINSVGLYWITWGIILYHIEPRKSKCAHQSRSVDFVNRIAVFLSIIVTTPIALGLPWLVIKLL